MRKVVAGNLFGPREDDVFLLKKYFKSEERII